MGDNQYVVPLFADGVPQPPQAPPPAPFPLADLPPPSPAHVIPQIPKNRSDATDLRSVNEKDIAANVTNNVTNAAATGQADYKKKAKAGSKGNKDDPGEEVNKSLEAANLKNANLKFGSEEPGIKKRDVAILSILSILSGGLAVTTIALVALFTGGDFKTFKST